MFSRYSTTKAVKRGKNISRCLYKPVNNISIQLSFLLTASILSKDLKHNNTSVWNIYFRKKGFYLNMQSN